MKEFVFSKLLEIQRFRTIAWKLKIIKQKIANCSLTKIIWNLWYIILEGFSWAHLGPLILNDLLEIHASIIPAS